MSHFSLAVLHRERNVSFDELMAPFDEATDNPEYLTFEEDEEGPLDEKMGKRGYYRNKNAKYDWFVPGGRWRGLIKLKPGATSGRYAYPSADEARPNDPTRCDTAQIKDIDFTPSAVTHDLALMVWDHVVEGKPWSGKEDEAPLKLHKPQYYLDLYGDREAYARQASMFSVYAYLKDGEWHEPGQMGWFGCSSETRESKAAYLKDFDRDVTNADPEMYLTILDCHI